MKRYQIVLLAMCSVAVSLMCLLSSLASHAQLAPTVMTTTAAPVPPPVPPPPSPLLDPVATSATNIPLFVLNSAIALTTDQKAEINKLQSDERSQLQKIWRDSLSRPMRQTEVEGIDSAAASKIVALLTDRQIHQLDALIYKIDVLDSDNIPTELAVQLDLSADQLARIEAVNDASATAIDSEKLQFEQKAEPRQLYTTEFLLLRSLGRKRISDMLDIMTPAQRNTIDDYGLQNRYFANLWRSERDIDPTTPEPISTVPSK